MTLDDCRRFYGEEIRFAANISSPALIDAFTRVPREKYLGPGPWLIASPDLRGMGAPGGMQTTYTEISDPRQLYHNIVVVLDKASDINNGQPSALAKWIDSMDLKPGERAYHVGCGVGYYTAIMAELVGPEGSVAGSEFVPTLAERAKQNLTGYPQATVHAGDGATYDPGECDAMLINAGCTHPLPLWLDRLSEGGRLIIPLTIAITPTLGAGMMVKIVRHGDTYSVELVSSLAIYSCKNARDPNLETLLRTAMTKGGLSKVKSVRRDPHESADSCILHGEGVCLSSNQAEYPAPKL